MRFRPSAYRACCWRPRAFVVRPCACSAPLVAALASPSAPRLAGLTVFLVLTSPTARRTDDEDSTLVCPARDAQPRRSDRAPLLSDRWLLSRRARASRGRLLLAAFSLRRRTRRACGAWKTTMCALQRRGGPSRDVPALRQQLLRASRRAIELGALERAGSLTRRPSSSRLSTTLLNALRARRDDVDVARLRDDDRAPRVRDDGDELRAREGGRTTSWSSRRSRSACPQPPVLPSVAAHIDAATAPLARPARPRRRPIRTPQPSGARSSRCRRSSRFSRTPSAPTRRARLTPRFDGVPEGAHAPRRQGAAGDGVRPREHRGGSWRRGRSARRRRASRRRSLRRTPATRRALAALVKLATDAKDWKRAAGL